MAEAVWGEHTHGPKFGKRVDGCPRCEELKAGAKPIHPPNLKDLPKTPTSRRNPKVKLQEEYLVLAEAVGAVKASQRMNIYRSTIQRWLQNPEFAERYKNAIRKRQGKELRRAIDTMSLEAFREKVLGRKTYSHMKQWRDWMEDPESDHILIVTCPAAGKTTFIRDYILYRIAQQPEIRIAYVSLAEAHAKKQIEAIKNVIESNDELISVADRLKPDPSDPHPWAATHFMVRLRRFTRGQDEADATLRCYGMGSQIVGSRLDLVIIDDPDQEGLGDLQREEIFERIMMNIESRLNIGGKLIVICNRWGERDVASRIMAQERQLPGLWKVFSSPAIIREATPREDKPGLYSDYGEVIWPEKFGTKTGIVGDRWTAKRAWTYFKNKRLRMGSRRFAIQFQNDPAADTERDFTAEVLNRALLRGADIGGLKAPDGATMICSLDPAAVEGAAVLAYALLPDGTRQVVDFAWETKRRTTGLLEWIADYCARYRPTYFGVEAQGPWAAFADSPEVKRIIDASYDRWGRRTTLVQLKTGVNKYQGDIAISGLAPIISDLLIIPSKTEIDRELFAELVRQFLVYAPPSEAEMTKRKNQGEPFDAVIAVWLAERIIASYRLTERSLNRSNERNSWGSPYGNDSLRGGSFALTRR